MKGVRPFAALKKVGTEERRTNYLLASLEAAAVLEPRNLSDFCGSGGDSGSKRESMEMGEQG